jgi:hypothetical protein
MKLSGIDLHDLRRGLRDHPEAPRHAAKLDSINRMRASGLLALAKKLGIDPEAIIKEIKERNAERLAHSTRFPAFRGTLDFDLTVELLGNRVTRKARADYSFTPEWPYHDMNKQAEFKG